MKITKQLIFHCKNCGNKIENKQCGMDLSLENITSTFFTSKDVEREFLFHYLSDNEFSFCNKECEDKFIEKIKTVFMEIKKEIKK